MIRESISGILLTDEQLQDHHQRRNTIVRSLLRLTVGMPIKAHTQPLAPCLRSRVMPARATTNKPAREVVRSYFLAIIPRLACCRHDTSGKTQCRNLYICPTECLLTAM